MSDAIYLTRDERLLLTLLSKYPFSVGLLSGLVKDEWEIVFKGLYDKKLTTPISGPYGTVAYEISDAGRALLPPDRRSRALPIRGSSLFDNCYRDDENEERTW